MAHRRNWHRVALRLRYAALHCHHDAILHSAARAQAYWVQRLERAVAMGKDSTGFMKEQKELEKVRWLVVSNAHKLKNRKSRGKDGGG